MDFVIIANAWTAARDNPTSKHQIALELARQGHRVLWMAGAGMRRPSLGSGTDRGRIIRKLSGALRGAVRVPGSDNLRVLSPLLIPLPAHPAVRRFNGWLYRMLARFWCACLGFRRPVLINYVPVLAHAMQGWRGTRVYHCVDRWDRFDMYDAGLMADMDALCRTHADLVIASSMELESLCRRDHAHVHRVNHGVSHDHFAQALDRSDGSGAWTRLNIPSGPVIGFFGLLSEWVDQDLLVKTAGAIPGAQVVLIGTADVDISRLKGCRNIHIIGPRPYRELPALVAYFDVGVIPFIVNDLTRAVNPIKLREMLAAGCPVVSTRLPEVEAYADIVPDEAVQIAETEDAFIARVREFTENPPDAACRRRISDAMLSETWEAKVNEIVTLVTEYGNKNRI